MPLKKNLCETRSISKRCTVSAIIASIENKPDIISEKFFYIAMNNIIKST